MIFDDKPPGEAGYFQHDLGAYKLEARVLFNEGKDWPQILSIHGARSDYTKANTVNFALQKAGISTLSINMSGHNEMSPLPLEHTCLANNIKEAEAFFHYLDTDKPKIVIAYSMGGTPALKLLEKHAHQIDKLILFYPGVYAKDSYDKAFGEPFRSIISQPFSYLRNDTIELLKQFPGKLLLIKGEYDGLDARQFGKPEGTSVGEVLINGEKYSSPIPKDVIDLVYNAADEKRRQLIEVAGSDHGLLPWMRSHPHDGRLLIDKIVDVINA